MIFREIKITGKKTLKITIPESWDDVTFKQLASIEKEKDPLNRVAILTGIPVNLFEDVPELADFYVWLESNLSWSSDWVNESSECEVFILGDEVFSFPKDIGMLSIGLYKDIQSEAQENKDNILSIYPLICASYYQVLKDGEYDYTKAKEYIDLFNNQPCVKVYNAANFFLTKVKELRSGTKKGLKSQVIRMIRKWLGLIGYPRYSDLKLRQLN